MMVTANNRSNIHVLAIFALAIFAGSPPTLAAHAGSDLLSRSPESVLRAHLLGDSGYDAMAVPNSRNSGAGVDVQVQMALYKLREIQAATSTLSVMVWFRVKWVDERLKWDPAEFGGLKQTVFRVSSSSEDAEIWIPDLEVYNTAEALFTSVQGPGAQVYSDGSVFLSLPGELNLACIFGGLEMFPYDELTCNVTIGAWIRSGLTLGIKPFQPKNTQHQGVS